MKYLFMLLIVISFAAGAICDQKYNPPFTAFNPLEGHPLALIKAGQPYPHIGYGMTVSGGDVYAGVDVAIILSDDGKIIYTPNTIISQPCGDFGLGELYIPCNAVIEVKDSNSNISISDVNIYGGDYAVDLKSN